MFVHVRDEAEHTCRPAFVLARGSVGMSLLRVLYPTPRSEAIGYQDTEAWYRHRDYALIVPNPDGTERRLDTWHAPDDCGQE
jgi:hypothetical protein